MKFKPPLVRTSLNLFFAVAVEERELFQGSSDRGLPTYDT